MIRTVELFVIVFDYFIFSASFSWVITRNLASTAAGLLKILLTS